MHSTRKQLIALIEHKAIPANKVRDALTASRLFPDAGAWRVFIDTWLLWLGGLALAFALLFFVAYNWINIGRFAKFGLVEIAIMLAVAGYWKYRQHKVAGKLALLVASIVLGVLLALYGQTYQTGADTWQLFFSWALLMLPWVVIAQFPALWVFWLSLINLALVLYFQVSRSFFAGTLGFMFDFDQDVFWALFCLNTLALISWELFMELFGEKKWPWLGERWVTRLMAIAGGMSLTWLVVFSILEAEKNDIIAFLVWICWLAALYGVYRKRRPDLFMLAGGCLSALVVVVTFLGKLILERAADSGGFLLLALLVLGLGTGAALWLKRVNQRFAKERP